MPNSISVGKESDTGTLEAGATFLFEIFKDEGMVTHNTTVKLKSMFGPFPASAATKACDVVQRLKFVSTERKRHRYC